MATVNESAGDGQASDSASQSGNPGFPPSSEAGGLSFAHPLPPAKVQAYADTNGVPPRIDEAILADRLRVSCEATWQIDALLDMLKREEGEEGFELVFASTLKRLKDLCSVVMSVVTDDSGRPISEMVEVVHGR